MAEFWSMLFATGVVLMGFWIWYVRGIGPLVPPLRDVLYDKFGPPEEAEEGASELPGSASKPEAGAGSAGSRGRQQMIDIMALSALIEQAVAIGVAKALSKAAAPAPAAASAPAAAPASDERALRARLLAELLALDLIASGKRMQATATALGVATSGRAYDEAAKTVRDLEATVRRERGLVAVEAPPPLIIRDNGGPPRAVPREGPIEALAEPMPKMEPVP